MSNDGDLTGVGKERGSDTPPPPRETAAGAQIRLALLGAVWRLVKRPWLLWPLVGLFVALFLYASLTTYVGPNEIGVLRVRFGPGKGIRKKAYTTGLRFVIPSLETLYRFPRNVQVLSYNAKWRRERSWRRGRRVIPPIVIQTSEGYNVTCDVTVLYRIVDAVRVMKDIGPGRLYESSALIPRSEKILRRVLGELNAEEFYTGTKRVKQAVKALEQLRRDLEPKGILVLDVLVKQFVYGSRYQRTIERRKLQDQRVFLRKAEKLATIQEYRKRVIEETGRAAVRAEMARGAKEVAKIVAQGSLYERGRRARADLLVKIAQAEAVRLKAEALRGAGSDNLVGLKMADVLKGTKLIVLTSDGKQGFNPLRLRSALKMFDVLGRKERSR